MRTIWLIFLFVFGISVINAQDDTVMPEMLADPNGAFATVDDIRIYYVAEGDPANPVVLLLHGFNSSNFAWRENINALAEAGFYVVAPDWPPFGLSDKSTEIDYSFRSIAGYMVGLLDALEIDSAHIVGHSVGGWITSYIAAEHTERVESVVLVAGGLFDLEVEGLLSFSATDPDSPFGFLAQLDPNSPEAQGMIRGMFNPGSLRDSLAGGYADADFLTEAIVAGYARPLLLDDWAAGFLAYAQAENPDPLTLEQMVEATQDINILILWGEDDTTVPIGLGELMDEALANSEFIRYPAQRHSLLEEAADQINADLIAFLSEQSE